MIARSLAMLVTAALLFNSVLSAQSGWYTLTSGTTTDLNSVFFTGVDSGYIAGQDGLLLRTFDAGLTWATAPTGVTVNLNDLYFFTQDTGVAVGDNGTIIRSTDAGQTWAPLASGVTDNLYTVSFDCDHPNGVAGGSSQTILNSTDRGMSWSIVQKGFFGGEFNGSSMANNNLGMIGGENSIFAPLMASTEDGGANWAFNTFYLNSNEGQISDIHAFGRTTGIAVSQVWDGTGAISRTADGGVNWTTDLFPEDLRGLSCPTAAIGFAVGAFGTILATTDGGITWEYQTSGVSVGLDEVSFPDSVNGYIVGDNGVILKTTTGGIVTSSEPLGLWPTETRLVSTYPNPFNPETNIRFQIAPASPEGLQGGGRADYGFVNLTITDVLGRTVSTLINERVAPGTYILRWNATGLSSGIYFARLQVGSLVDVRRMVYLR